MEAVSAFLQTYDTDYNLMAISNQTLAKLLAGKFKTFEELLDFSFDSIGTKSIEILYQRITNPSTEYFNYIIETIFTYE
ncbi:hypothetical protein V3A08_05660 [Tenacibaculum maritimum]|uniref:hypothetical protein n=1 Tax=Tenacibaculum maritimum TaxID=107401 RepID=UPI0012E5FDAB|nr:hypothetical protein [Tenacibaculum maritimum]CAA0220252.1 conserved hypothetical protein [Tenacibaculum maritimum]